MPTRGIPSADNLEEAPDVRRASVLAPDTAITDEVGLDDVVKDFPTVVIETADTSPPADLEAIGAGFCAAGVGWPHVWPELSAQACQTRLHLILNCAHQSCLPVRNLHGGELHATGINIAILRACVPQLLQR